MDIKISFGKEWDRIQKFMRKGVEKPVEQVVNQVAGYAENRVALRAKEMVYSWPESQSYQRTGNLLGGRGSALSGGKPARFEIDPTTVKVVADPRLRGAKTNYAVFVNEGTPNMPARPFFDVAVQDTQDKAPILAKEILDKHFKQL